MKRKIMTLSILTVFMLVTISLISSAEVNSDVRKKGSPLFKIRFKLTVGEKIGNLIENIKIRFLGERMLFIPALIKNSFSRTSPLITFMENPSEIWASCCPKTLTPASYCFDKPCSVRNCKIK